MKFRALSILLLIVSVPAALLAQERDVAEAKEAPAHQGPVRAWMGVAVTSAPEALAHQLKVPRGVGLVVEYVQPKSPAESAGVKPYDLLIKLDDQWLINPEQFSVLVSMHHGGDSVKLTYLREGNEQTANVQLVEHEAPPEFDAAPWPVPGDRAPADGGGHRARGNSAEGQERIISWIDGPRQVSVVTTAEGHTRLQVKDSATGRVVFEGPIDTAEQRGQLPPEMKGVLEMLGKITAELNGKDWHRTTPSTTAPGD